MFESTVMGEDKDLYEDYVSLFSIFETTKDKWLIMDKLTCLAEMGQVDACVLWYRLAEPKEINKIIDANVESLDGYKAKELLAKAFLDYHHNNRREQELEIYRVRDSWAATSDDEKNEELLTIHLRKSPYFYHYKRAVDLYYKNFHYTQNPLFYERFCELEDAMTYEQKTVAGAKRGNTLIEIMRLRATLLKEYNCNPDDVDIALALACNLTHFVAFKKKRALGVEIFKKLAKRPLSQKLMDYYNEKHSTNDNISQS